MDFLNTGSISLGAAGTTITFNGGFTSFGNPTNPSMTYLASTIRTSGDAMIIGPVTATADFSLQTATGDIVFNSTIDGDGHILRASTGSLAGQPGDIELRGNVTDGRNIFLECYDLSIGLAGSPILMYSNTGPSPDSDITFRIDSLTSLDLGNSVDAGDNGVFAVGPRGVGSIEFAQTNSPLIATDYYYSTNFIIIRAAAFRVGGAAYSDDLFIGNDLPTSISYSVETMTSGTTSLGDWRNTDDDSLTINAAGSIAPVRFWIPMGAADQNVGIDLGGGSFTVHGTMVLMNDTLISADGGITLDGSIDDAAAGTNALTLNSAGTVVIQGELGGTNPLAGLSMDAGGTTRIEGGLMATTGDQTYMDAVMLAGDTEFVADAASTIRFGSTLGGGVTARALTITGAGARFDGTVGGAANLLSSLSAGADVLINASQVITSGNQDYAGDVSLGADSSLSGVALSFDSDIIGVGHSLTLNGSATIGDAAADSVSGLSALTVNGSVELYAGSVATGAGGQAYGGSLTLHSDVALSAANGDISLGGAILTAVGSDLQNDLSLAAGTGDIILSGSLGTATLRLGAVSIISAGDVAGDAAITSACPNIRALRLSQVSGSGLSWFGNIYLAGTGAGNGLDLAVHSARLSGLVQTDIDAPVSVNASQGAGPGRVLTLEAAADISSGGAVELNAVDGVLIAADIATSGDDVSFLSATRLTGSIVIDTGAGPGDVSFSAALTGTTAGLEDLAIDAGTGAVSFAGLLGATRLGDLAVTRAQGGLSASAAINAASVSIVDGGSVDLNGAVSALGGFSSAGAGGFDNTGGSITTQDAPIAIHHAGAVVIGSSLSAGDGGVDIASSASTVSLNASIAVDAGAVTIDSATGTSSSAAGDISAIGAATIEFGATGAGALSAAGDVTSAGGSIRFHRALSLTGPVAISTGIGEGDILFDGVVTQDGTPRDLSLLAGAGSIALAGQLGSPAQPLGSLWVQGAFNLAGNTGAIADAGAIHANTINIDAIGGTARFGAINSYAAGGIDIDAESAYFDGPISAAAGGSFTLSNNAQASFAAAADLSLDGSFVQDGAGEVLLNADIGAAGASGISFNSLVVIASPLSLSSSGGGDIGFSAGQDLYVAYAAAGTTSIDAGTGRVIVPRDLHIHAPNGGLRLGSELSVRNMVKYSGLLDMGGNALSSSQDIVLIGGDGLGPLPDYGIDDAESGTIGLFSYNNAVRNANGTYPGNALADYHAVIQAGDPINGYAISSAAYGGGATGLASVTVGMNFYANGGSYSGESGAGWTLTIPGNDDAAIAFAEAYNAVFNDAAAAGGWVAASENVSLNGCAGNWDTGAAEFMAGTAGGAESGTVTIYDDVIRVAITDDPSDPDDRFENDRDEIWQAVMGMRLDGGTQVFTGAYTDPACTQPTTGQGDLAFFYLQADPDARWNTDADGTGPGDLTVGGAVTADMGQAGTTLDPARSTDRRGVPRDTVPNIMVLKASNALFQSLRDHHKNRIAHHPAVAPFTGVADACRPVLVGVGAGQALHETDPDSPRYANFDGHNYLQLRYSEAVNLGDLDGTSENVRSQAAFGVGEHGGALSQSGTDQRFLGYLSVAGSVSSGSRDATPQTEALYRRGYDLVLNATGAAGADSLLDSGNVLGLHGLYISVAGWSYDAGGYRFWPGYLDGLSDPSDAAAIARSPYNPFIRDQAGNPVEPAVDDAPPAGYAVDYVKADVTVASLPKADSPTFMGWDVVKPRIAIDTSTGTPYYEVLPLASADRIDRIEFRLAEELSAGVFSPESIRDTSFGLGTGSAFPQIPRDAFLLSDTVRDGGVFRQTGSGFATDVSSRFFTPSFINVDNDPYLALTFLAGEEREYWNARSAFYFRYDRDRGRLTDLAGNLMDSYLGNDLACVERLAPRIRLSSAVNGGNLVYIQFSEPVWHADNADIEAADFSVAGTAGALTVTALEILSRADNPNPSGNDPAREVMLTLSGPLSGPDIMSARILGSANIYDRLMNSMDVAESHRISDFGLGIIQPLSATDGVHRGNEVGAGALGALRSFDGSGRLYDRNVTVTARLAPDLPTASPVEMFYDVSPPPQVLFLPSITVDGVETRPSIWLPSLLPGLFTDADTQARTATPVASAGADRSFLVPAGDAEVRDGARVEFVYRVGDLFCLRSVDPNDPRRIDVFSYRVEDIRMQRGGVTVLNNVIDPGRGERAAIRVELPESGSLSVMVFTLDGDIVRVLNRAPSAAGTFSFSWDGLNTAGRPVGRGLYFIRVVGPGIDEVRKVMVVKER